jgi:hypothetical protein
MATRIASSPQVKCAHTQKLFFGRFAYSFTVPFAQSDLDAVKRLPRYLQLELFADGEGKDAATIAGPRVRLQGYS